MTMPDPKDIEGYEVPLHVSLTYPPLFAGVPREFGIITLVLTLVVTVGLRMWWLGLPAGLVLHATAAALTRHDAYWLPVFRRHMRQPTFLDW